MQGIQRVLTIIALAYIIYHIYSHGFTTVNIIAALLLVFAAFMELTKKQRKAKIDAYIKRKEEEALQKEAQQAAAEAAAHGTATEGATAAPAGTETVTADAEGAKKSNNGQ
ncbi:MAG: hypothetical protein KHZ77_02120 [Veillonella sp.]|uniref:hypothetical protein n=1 Tax=Veillonella sp. TaxID=1926307 RepID=UPI0025F2879C|nr:hypothetical protein [Veillonella sp.]MBS4912942.1 hypothetical protein [Veillonella sp.]